MSKDRPWGKGTPTWVRDVTANDSDKSFTVPAGKMWEPFYVIAQLTCTAVAGNRTLRIEVTNGTNNIWQSWASVAGATGTGQTLVHFTGSHLASGTTQEYALDSTSVVNSGCQDSGPKLYLPAGYGIRAWDLGAVDAAGDDLIVILHYIEYDA